MEESQLNFTKKSVKKDANRVGIAMLLYAFISMVVSVMWLIGETIIKYILRTADVTDEALRDKIFDETLMEIADYSGTYFNVGVIVGIAFLFLIFLKSGINRKIFVREKKMTPLHLVGVAGVFLGGQLVFQLAYYLMEALLNLIGITAQTQMETATAGSETLSMFLYAGIIGPIAEELVFRGFAMRCLEKHGKMLAIVVSSILFGVMHGNLPQGMFAFFVGLVLAYVAMEYSIIWSIALHIFNNMVLCDFLYMAIKDYSETVQLIITYGIQIIFFIMGLVTVILKRKEIKAFICQNMWEKPKMRWTMTTVTMILFVVIHLFIAIITLEKL